MDKRVQGQRLQDERLLNWLQHRCVILIKEKRSQQKMDADYTS
jgi:hypothetical protein